MKKVFLLIFCLLLTTEHAIALRCSNKIVDIGDRLHKVHRFCGDPTYVDSYDQPVSIYPYPNASKHIDVWTYNFGSTRFMQELIFENGILRYINQLGYGY